METRMPDFAGSWYPSRESDCRALIQEFIREAGALPSTGKPPVGGIVPHAGWVYSGKIACNVIRCLKEGNPAPDTMLIFGRHLPPGGRNHIMKEGRWATPLGNLEIDSDLAERLTAEFPFVVETVNRHGQDNTIELQLPFVKYFCPDINILPLGIPPSDSSLEIGKRAVEIAGELGRRVVVLGSTDLTHYGWNYGYTPEGVGEKAVEWVKNENDRRVIERMLALDAAGVVRESLRNQNACCGGAVAAAIAGARELGAAHGLKLFYMTSYDIQKNDSFVGYVGIVFS
ncbi:MAG: AmmeMemoRadiSam system protein B [Deltaproteobacteria bacterium]|nr:AmmeMemoRadiSam system protein B [Deltaproteobacteria bacterium]